MCFIRGSTRHLWVMWDTRPLLRFPEGICVSDQCARLKNLLFLPCKSNSSYTPSPLKATLYPGGSTSPFFLDLITSQPLSAFRALTEPPTGTQLPLSSMTISTFLRLCFVLNVGIDFLILQDSESAWYLSTPRCDSPAESRTLMQERGQSIPSISCKDFSAM